MNEMQGQATVLLNKIQSWQRFGQQPYHRPKISIHPLSSTKCHCLQQPGPHSVVETLRDYRNCEIALRERLFGTLIFRI
jgi:hypothetical protein